MSDGNFDPCECIWSHQSAMQRLMNLLRQSQSYCTETGCENDLPGPQGDPTTGNGTMMMIMMGWIVLATALYLFRPPSLRNRGDMKPDRQGPSGNNPPRPPPVL